MKNFFTIFCMLFLFATISSYSQFSGGDGSAGNPWQISSEDDLTTLMGASTYWSDHFILTADLDMAEENCSPIGLYEDEFRGTFDGNGHTISNVEIDDADPDDFIGFFGYIGEEGRVFDLKLVNVNITGPMVVGGFVGGNDGNINNCSVSGEVTSLGDDYSYSDEYGAGGFVGWNFGVINNCKCSGNVSGDYYVGGFVSWNAILEDLESTFIGFIYNSHTTSTVYANEYCGGGFVAYNGLVSFKDEIPRTEFSKNNSRNYKELKTTKKSNRTLSKRDKEKIKNDILTSKKKSKSFNTLSYEEYENASIRNCSAKGNVYGGEVVGGFVGYNFNSDFETYYYPIVECFATGSVSGAYSIGGFCGLNLIGMILNCYSSGNATGTDPDDVVGGFSGSDLSVMVSYCYSTGRPSKPANQADPMPNVDYDYVGGFVGENLLGFGIYYCNYWNTETSGKDEGFGDGNTDDEVTGLTSSQFSNLDNFSCLFDENPNVWAMGAGGPILNNTTIPTLSEWAVIIFISLLAGVGGWFVWRRLV
jgi:hypothetical protein